MRDLMRRLKWVVIVLFALVAALLVAAYAIITNYPVEDLKALIQDEARRLTGRELVIDGTVEMAVLPSPAIVMEGVRLKNAPWAAEPEMLTLGRVEAEVAFWPLIGGDIEVRRLVLSDAFVALERTAEGAANWQMGAEEGGATGSLPIFSDVRLERVTLSLDDRQSGLSHSIVLDEANARSEAGQLALSAAGRFDASSFALTATLPDLPALGAAAAALPVMLSGTLGEAALRLEGKMGPLASGANDFRLWLEAPDLAALVPGLPPGPVKLEAAVLQKSAEIVSVPLLQGTLGGSAFDGALDLELGGERPRIAGKLHLGKVAVPAAAGDGSGLFPDAPLPFALLHEADVSLLLTVDELAMGAKTLTNLTTQVALEGGKLDLDPLGFGHDGGNFTGAVHSDASVTPPATTLRLAGSGLPLGPATDGVLNGSAAIDLDLAAKGESPKAMAASLSGRSEVSAAGGTIDSELTTLASAPLAALLRPLMGSSSGQARLNCLVNRMAWQNGVGTNQGTALDAEGFTVVGNGTVDLRSETIDFYFDTWSKDAALVGLALPMTARGPLTDPVVAPDPAGTALGIAKTAGLIVFPPAGLAAIIGDRAISEDGNPCVAAVEKVEEGGGASNFFEDAGTAITDTVESVGEGAGEVIDSIGEGAEDAIEGLKGLFSN